MKHPYYILTENISKYSKNLKAEDIKQYATNAFQVDDVDFDKVAFFNDVKAETGIEVKEHEYIGSSCADPHLCFKPYTVYGFDNVLFYIANEKF